MPHLEQLRSLASTPVISAYGIARISADGPVPSAPRRSSSDAVVRRARAPCRATVPLPRRRSQHDQVAEAATPRPPPMPADDRRRRRRSTRSPRRGPRARATVIVGRAAGPRRRPRSGGRGGSARRSRTRAWRFHTRMTRRFPDAADRCRRDHLAPCPPPPLRLLAVCGALIALPCRRAGRERRLDRLRQGRRRLALDRPTARASTASPTPAATPTSRRPTTAR